MPVRLKKLIGAILLMILVSLYSVIAVWFAVRFLSDASAWVHLAYFLFSGLLWILPAMLIIKLTMLDKKV